jgi:hypothetical protein
MIAAKGIRAMAERAAETGQREWPRLGHVALFALAYYVSGQLGLLFAAPPDFVSALWPPAALTLVAALHLGRGAWLVIWATALLAGSWWSAFPQVGPAHAIAVIAVAAAGSTVRAVLGAHLLRRFGGAVPSLRHTRTAGRSSWAPGCWQASPRPPSGSWPWPSPVSWDPTKASGPG